MIYITFSRSNAALLCAALFLLLPGVYSQAQTHEIKQEVIDAMGWFGGDDRPDNRRNVAVGQLVLIDRAMTINSFSFHYGAPFDFVQNPIGGGHEVTLRLSVRNVSGAILKSVDQIIPDTFTSGWVVWDGLDIAASQDEKMYFTAYLVGGYDANPYTSSYSASTTDPYPAGNAVLKHGVSDDELNAWGDWVDHSWDSAFRLSGTLLATGIADGLPQWAPDIRLEQNYPNPLSNHTVFEYSLSSPVAVRLDIYNMLGTKLGTLVDAGMSAGSHRLDWTNDALPNGIYTVVLRAGGNVAIRMVSIVR